VSPANIPDPVFFHAGFFDRGSFGTPRFLLLALFLTLVDQFAAPILHSTSPLWATAACLLLVWRRGKISPSPGGAPLELLIPAARLVAFVAAHGVLIFSARSWGSTLQGASGAMTVEGTFIAAWKLIVLAPAAILFPFTAWKKIASTYFPEAIAGLVVLLTFFPSRALGTFWPWYGQALGRFVHTLARVFVPKLAYLADSNPTLSGPELDVNIIPECSGINGLELFDYLFGAVVFLDWNRLRKGRALFAYFMGVMAMLFGNAIRITSFVVFGNTASRKHFTIPYLGGLDFFLRRVSRISFDDVRLDARQERYSRATSAGQFVAPIASHRAHHVSLCAGQEGYCRPANAAFPAVNFLSLATLLAESSLGVNPPIQNAELHAPLRIIPETFEAVLLRELRLSL
jgi:exosortase/archaeosortase family protein